MSYSLNTLKGVVKGKTIYIYGTTIGVKGDTRSLKPKPKIV